MTDADAYTAELAAHRDRMARAEAAGLDLFTWPEAPPATDEQVTLPVDGTIEGRWQAWLATEAGAAAFDLFCQYARQEAAMGARYLGAKALWERVRRETKLQLNNTFTPHAAREAEARYPQLRGLFHHRQRRAA